MDTLLESSTAFIGEIIITNQQIQAKNLFSEETYPVSQDDQNKASLNAIVSVYLNDDQTAELRAELAAPGSAKAELYHIAAQSDLNPLFPVEVVHEVNAFLNNPGIDDTSLTDLTHLPFCSIDGADTRDLDQALYIEASEHGHRIYYALADASHYVQPGSALFEEALRRGASYYLPGLMIPMLPRALSEGLVSLNQAVNRRAMVVQMDLDQSGRCFKTEIQRARICNRAKLSFLQVLSFLEQKPDNNADTSPIINDDLLSNSIQQLKVVGERRLRLSEQRHVVRYQRNETNIKLGNQGLVFTILSDLRNPVELYNEQLSLLCNTECARLLNTENDANAKQRIQPIYRVHPQPPLDKIQGFEKTVLSLVEIHGLDPGIWLWKNSGDVSLSEYLRNLPGDGEYARIAQVIHRQAVLTNVRSVFSEQAAQHYGVGSDIYARFSAPMREIVGVFLHKELFEMLAAHHSGTTQEDEVLRDQVIAIANASREQQKQITREANRLVLDQLFHEDLAHDIGNRKHRTGTVMGFSSSRIYVVLDEPAVEVKVYLQYTAELLGTEFSINEDSVSLIRTDNQQIFTRIGDPVSIIVQSRDSKRDRWVLLIDHNNN